MTNLRRASTFRASLGVAALVTILAPASCDRTPAPSPASPPAPATSSAGADSPWEKARLKGIEFRAIGQEPGWLVEIDQGHELRYTGDYGETRFVAPAPQPTRDATSGTITYTAREDSHELILIIREAPCQDVMSGEPFPYHVSVRLDAREVKGCGKTLATGDLFGVYWKLIELNGVAVASTSGPREAHLRFTSEGSSVSGSTGCNSLNGSLTLAADHLRLGTMITTRMACLDPALQRQEQEFLRALEAARRFSNADGRLSLFSGEKAIARFAAVHLR